MKKTIEKALKDYKRKKYLVEASEERVEAWKHAIKNPEILESMFLNQNTSDAWIPGSQRSTNTVNSSSIEIELIKKEETIEKLLKLIEKEESKTFLLKLEVNQIDKSLLSLNDIEIFIIQCKYFEGMTWMDVERNVNEKFEDKYITTSGLRKINCNTILKLNDILDSFYKSIQ